MRYLNSAIAILALALLAACGGDGSNDDPDTADGDSSGDVTFMGSCTCPGTNGPVCFEYSTTAPEACNPGVACGFMPSCTQGGPATCGTDVKGAWSDGRCKIPSCCYMPPGSGVAISTCYGATDADTVEALKNICLSVEGATWN